jgi:Tfp pilus assembly protein PilO
MSANEGQDRRGDKKSAVFDYLHNPTQLRMFLMAVVLGVGYTAIYLPLDTTIAATTRKLVDAKRRLALADDLDVVQKQFRQIQSRIPNSPDASEWMQYVLSGLRQTPLRLDSFSPDTPKAMGTYQILTIKIKVSGSFEDIDKFLYWLESNPRLFRVDSVRLISLGAKGAEAGNVVMDLVVVGVIG